MTYINEANQVWAKQGSVLLVVLSRNNFTYDDRPSKTHSFDAGAACQNLALEATSRDLITHALEGFDYNQVKLDLKIPDNYSVEAMIVAGKLGKTEDLPEALQSRETPSTRKPLAEIASEGEFVFN